MNITVCNPLLRTPLSLIVDDSCPVINLTYYWIQQRHAWKTRHQPGVPPDRWEGNAAQLKKIPPTIPADFAAEWAEWCWENGVKGKFSLIPYPAGVGRVDEGFPTQVVEKSSTLEYQAWLRVYRELIWPSFDLTPEMLTHTAVVDLDTFTLTEAWEQVEWVDPPVGDRLTDYIITAMEMLDNVGIPCEGVTSPGAFGKRQEAAYAKAVLTASQHVNNNPRPFYFLWLKHDELPDVPIWYPEKENGIAIASIVACAGDWFGGWTGYDLGDADRFITEDGQGGRLPPILEKELPCVLVGHWPGFYFNGEKLGFDILKTVKARLDNYDPDGTKTLWMKTSEIGHYWMARELTDITVIEAQQQINLFTQFPTANFTLAIDAPVRHVQVNGWDLREVHSRRDFQSDTFLVEDKQTFIAFDLEVGDTILELVV
ncbi:hypothetical protein F4054_19595 [Candidatus Poribacteria bacterium]|nr:hypothetical protein [Candidatus Poribacteria bacterium]MYG05229.1 hypothetical protein [Candidatus Poribacteria bacterium]MYK24450.1 hypothetical protein [Candidatus Poribacteria bacterium]